MNTSLQAAAALRALNTLALPASATWLARIDDVRQLAALRADPRLAGRPRFILGGGSNIVLAGDFDGLMLQVALTGRACVAEDTDAWYVRAGAGESWHDFVQWTLAQGWPGLENLSLIPGTVGAAPIQNIGAYGLEVAERFHSLRAIDLVDGQERSFAASDCRFGYRDSVFKQEGWHRDGRFLIVDVTFRLPKRWQPVTRYADVANELAARDIAAPTARDIADAVIAIRRRKLPDPATLPNTGSFFQNPLVDGAVAAALHTAHPALPQYPQADGRVKLAAGWLIEQAGWKGKDLGPAGMYEQQALVLVNRGGATGSDVCALAAAVQADVAARFGVTLVPEPIYLGMA
ncbi:MAG: UDP-N-acetylmuramate dehydrogenase [Rhodocyclaceae bacterium]|nr:MAG: UDP-N-acetylmuramate dehydrogenase [Rhodocyclaceae bacterium]